MRQHAHHAFIIIGSGVGGATLARELVRRGHQVLIVERGKPATRLGTTRHALSYYDVNRLTQMPIASQEGIILWRALAAGGSSLVTAGNAVIPNGNPFCKFGIDLADEYAALLEALHVRPMPESCLSDGTRAIRQAAAELGYPFRPMPKFVSDDCTGCAQCTLGCAQQARWSAADWLEADREQIDVRYDTTVERILIAHGQAQGVHAIGPHGPLDLYGETVIVAAGGLGTPIILQHSGLPAGEGLFIDIFVNTCGVAKLCQLGEPLMSLVMDACHDQGFILSPYINTSRLGRLIEFGARGPLLPVRRTLGLMTKISDERAGRVHADGTISKAMTPADRHKLDAGTALARDILIRAGVEPRTILTSKPQGAHPGGTAAIGQVVDANLRTEVQGLYVCDGSVLPAAPGLPPIMTIAALARRLARHLVGTENPDMLPPTNRHGERICD